MIKELEEQYNEMLRGISDELDIPPSKYKQAVDRYTSVAKWLAGGSFNGCKEEPCIYPQGSFRLGTVVRPTKDWKKADYDIDLVCELKIEKSAIKPEIVKSAIGNRLKENGTYKGMLDREGSRCWSINYSEQDGIGFDLDILPCIPEDMKEVELLISIGVLPEHAREAISVTNKENAGHYSWSPSNPIGYAKWFDEINKPLFKLNSVAQKQTILENNRDIFESIEKVPNQLVRTPLQRVIQILKRHRDLRFQGHELESDKPISMIITTLAAKSYQNEPDVYTALKNIFEKLESHTQLLNPTPILDEKTASLHLIEKRINGIWHILNPVNPNENFADRWHENNNRKARAFFQWVSWVKSDLVEILNQTDIKVMANSLEYYLGEMVSVKSLSGTANIAPTILIPKKTDIPREIREPSKPWGSNA